MNHNIDPVTGIRYTMYACSSLNPDLLQELLYGPHATDLTQVEAQREEEARQRAEWEANCERLEIEHQEAGTTCPVHDDFEPNFDNFDPMIDEPIIEGNYEDVVFRTTWLGGAQMLWVFKSFLVGHFHLCSPCVPNACDGNSPNSINAGGFVGYAVPPDWLADHVDTRLPFQPSNIFGYPLDDGTYIARAGGHSGDPEPVAGVLTVGDLTAGDLDDDESDGDPAGLTAEQKENAVRYVENKYVMPSGDNIELDGDIDENDKNFSIAEDGVFVRAWLWCPAAEMNKEQL